MEILATLFVSLVTFANTLVPQANLPQVSGIHAVRDTAVSVTNDLKKEDGLVDRSAVRQRVREAVEETRNRRQETVDEFRANREKAREEMQTKREEFRTKLAEIKDARKRKIVELIGLRFEKLNERWVNHWNKVLARLAEILTKIGTRADKAEAAGRDVSAVRAAITAARAAISAAQDALNTQAGKTYVIEITNEENLGQNVRETIQLARGDLRGVREKVREARQAVIEALRVLKGIRGVDAVGTEGE